MPSPTVPRGTRESSPMAEENDGAVSDSTVDEAADPDVGYSVEDIHLARRGRDGEMYYLIKWTGYELHDMTWEPRGNLDEGTEEIWLEKEKRILSGECAQFDSRIYTDAKIEFWEQRVKRAQSRNARRVQRGLPVTETVGYYEQKLQEARDEAEIYSTDGSVDGRSDDHEHEGQGYDGESSEDGFGGDLIPLPLAPKSTVADEKSSLEEAVGVPATGTPSPEIQKATAEAAGLTMRPVEGPVPDPTPTAQVPQRPKPINMNSLRTRMKPKASNIFITGKTRKRKPSLPDAITNTAKPTKAFTNLHQANLANKPGYAKGGRAPLAPPPGLFNIRAGPGSVNQDAPVAPRPSLSSVASSSSLPPLSMVENKDRNAPSLVATHEPPGSIKDINDPAQKIKRKSVHFSPLDSLGAVVTDQPGQLSQEPEDMDLDDSLFVRNTARGGSPVLRDPGEDMTATATDLANTADAELTIDIGKRVSFSTASTTSIPNNVEAIFTGIPLALEQTWYRSFTKGQDPLHFTHKCLLQDLGSQFGASESGLLSTGFLLQSSINHTAALANVAQRLRSGSFAVACFQEEYTIVLYASRCNDWDPSIFGVQSDPPPEVELQHMIFAKVVDPLPLLPLSDESGSSRSIVMEKLLSLDYPTILPKKAKANPESHAFFLVFPASKSDMMRSTCLWLRACDPHCQILTSRQLGHWDAFCNNAKSGTIIFHEATIWTLRLLPRVRKKLNVDDSNFTFWLLAEAMRRRPMLPSGENLDLIRPPARITLARILPSGTAVLITPSFLLTQPIESLKLLEWHYNGFIVPDHRYRGRWFKLVVSSGIDKFMAILAAQTADELRGLVAKNKTGPDDPRLIAVRKQCEARFRAYDMMARLARISREADLVDPDEETCPLVFVDEAIHDGDEQSLVNWFGWWSITTCDRFRKFVVIGTSEADVKRGWGETTLPTPSYARGVVNDPDLAAQNAPLAGQGEQGGGDHGEVGRGAPLGPGDSAVDGRPASLRPFLRSLPLNTVLLMYDTPVSYCDIAEAEHFRDYFTEFSTFSSWFRLLRPFEKKPATKRVFGGLFLTPQISREAKPKDSIVYRRPWLAYYRPTNAHQWATSNSQDTDVELILWDSTLAREKFTGIASIREDDLLESQRKLIDFIRVQTKEKNPGTALRHVFLGGFKPITERPAQPLEETLEFLKAVAENIREYLPIQHFLLASRGFRPVVLAPPGNVVRPDPPDEDKTGDYCPNIIFHAPRGHVENDRRESRCTNHMFDAVEEVRRGLKSSPETFSYQYRATLDWYLTQEAEGRAFEHLIVSRWPDAFGFLGFDRRTRKGVRRGSGAEPPSKVTSSEKE